MNAECKCKDGKELRLKEYERQGVKRISGTVFIDGVGGKGFDVPIGAYKERTI